MGALPATASATVAATTSRAATSGPPRVAGDPVQLSGDTSVGPGSRQRGRFAWKGRKILFTESLPSKWDWSLSTALSKWNGTGGSIKFVRAANPRKAQLRIGYGNIGQAAGLATVGRSRHAFVKLSSRYATVDSLDMHDRIEVMAILTHELGHVLGFQHTSAPCSLMSPMLDVNACNTLPATLPGYYKCRTIDSTLEASFIRLYGGRARFPGTWCLIDPLPSQLAVFDFIDGPTTPMTIRWQRPTYVPSGSRVQVRYWSAPSCGGPVPGTATYADVSPSALTWREPPTTVAGVRCYRVSLVNRYGAGRSPIAIAYSPPVQVEPPTDPPAQQP